MSGIFEYMEKRRQMVERGLIGYDQPSRARFNQANPGRQMAAKIAAHMQQRADKSDPFVFDRVLSQVNNGTADPDDFSVDWRKEQIVSPMIVSAIHGGCSAVNDVFAEATKNICIDVMRPSNRKMA